MLGLLEAKTFIDISVDELIIDILFDRLMSESELLLVKKLASACFLAKLKSLFLFVNMYCFVFLKQTQINFVTYYTLLRRNNLKGPGQLKPAK